MYTTVYLKTFPVSNTKEIIQSLTEAQKKWIKQYTYRIDYNPVNTCHVLNIRTHTDRINYSEMLFLFPDAQIKGPAVS